MSYEDSDTIASSARLLLRLWSNSWLPHGGKALQIREPSNTGRAGHWVCVKILELSADALESGYTY